MPTTPVSVRWSDLDPYHHVNHATYLSYFEQARIAVLEHIGWGMRALEDAGYRVVLAHIDIRFRRPATSGDDLEVSTEVTDVGASASTWRQRLHRGDELLVEATIDAAATDLDGRPVRMPAGLRDALESLRTE